MQQFEIITRGESFKTKQTLQEDLITLTSANQALRNEYKGVLCIFCANFIFTFNGILTKILQNKYPDVFETNCFLLIRTVIIFLLSVFFSFFFQEPILSLNQIDFKLAFFTRTTLQYFGLSFYTLSVWYLRVSTSQIITLLNPIIIIMLSSCILKEKFYMRYVYGMLFCLSGSFIIVLNEKKASPGASNTASNEIMTIGTIIGVSFGLLSNFTGAFISIANKILASNHVPLNTQMFYLALSNLACTLIVFLFTKTFKICFGYALLCSFSGAIFFLGQYLFNKGIQIIDLSKSTMISYFKIIWVFLLSGLFLGESIFFTDILGASLIVSYLLYNVYNPIIEKK